MRSLLNSTSGLPLLLLPLTPAPRARSGLFESSVMARSAFSMLIMSCLPLGLAMENPRCQIYREKYVPYGATSSGHRVDVATGGVQGFNLALYPVQARDRPCREKGRCHWLMHIGYIEHYNWPFCQLICRIQPTIFAQTSSTMELVCENSSQRPLLILL